jgi:hypothetical protein
VAEQTLKRYASGDDSTKGSKGSGFVERKCWGCGLPHPWSKKEKGKYVVICPNADKPGIRANAAIQIKDFQEQRGRKTAKSSKRKNVNTLTWDDIPKERRAVLLQQHHSDSVVTTDGGSVASSITDVTTSQRPGARNSITLHQDVVILTGTFSLPPIPVAIHSPMARITLETGTANEEKDCPNLRCVFDTGAALSTANFHFMEAIVCQFRRSRGMGACQKLRVRNRHGRCTSHYRQEHPIWSKGTSDFAEGDCRPQTSWAHPSNSRWSLAIQVRSGC